MGLQLQLDLLTGEGEGIPWNYGFLERHRSGSGPRTVEEKASRR
jgi:hypothetical protein